MQAYSAIGAEKARDEMRRLLEINFPDNLELKAKK